MICICDNLCAWGTNVAYMLQFTVNDTQYTNKTTNTMTKQISTLIANNVFAAAHKL